MSKTGSDELAYHQLVNREQCAGMTPEQVGQEMAKEFAAAQEKELACHGVYITREGYIAKEMNASGQPVLVLRKSAMLFRFYADGFILFEKNQKFGVQPSMATGIWQHLKTQPYLGPTFQPNIEGEVIYKVGQGAIKLAFNHPLETLYTTLCMQHVAPHSTRMLC